MNVLYEEDGGFKAASLLADNDTSLQVEALHGKRSKIKSASVLLRFETPQLGEFMERAQAAAEELDVDFLWQCCGPEDFTFLELAREYYGHEPAPHEGAAVLMRLHAAPMYFYKKGKGRYKAAPEENLRAALAGLARRKKQEEIKARYIDDLVHERLPDAFKSQLNALLYDPDKSSLEYKALEAACAITHLSAPKLLCQCGAVASSHEYHLNRFLFEHFPDGTGFADYGGLDPDPVLPVASAAAFSIDDATTTEIDDAFSATRLDDGNWRVGIHIAAPALGFAPGSALDRAARRRLSTVYLPGSKITMLPDEAIGRFTLTENQECPALSLYLTVDPAGYRVLESQSRVERVHIAANLRHDVLETRFNESALATGEGDYPYKQELTFLWKFANSLEASRGQRDKPFNQVEYSFHVENSRVTIKPRLRGCPIDKVVMELMVYVNAEWGRQLAANKAGAIYRVQKNGKVAMDTNPGPHEGLGVGQYAWSSSPLRRYVDLVNQRQLIALFEMSAPPYLPGSDDLVTAMRDFEVAYEIYADFQHNMERYWCLRFLLQEQITETTGAVIRENLVRFNSLPLVCRVASLPELAPGTEVKLAITHVDPWELNLSCQYRGKAEC